MQSKHTSISTSVKLEFSKYVFLITISLLNTVKSNDLINFERNYRVDREYKLDKSVSYPITVSKHGTIEFGIQNLLEVYLNRTDFSRIITHGCWCAKFDPTSNLSSLGGASTDNLDQICKEWIVARHCNRLPGGSCENETNVNNKRGFYNIEVSNLDSPSCLSNVGFCAEDSCEIDVFYAMKIRTFLGNGGVSAEIASSCSGKVSEHRQRACVGTTPDQLTIVG